MLKKFFLREKFGNNYLNWAEKTPIFIPNNLSYDHPIMTFDWKKIIIKEKTGLFMLFLVFLGSSFFLGLSTHIFWWWSLTLLTMEPSLASYFI